MVPNRPVHMHGKSFKITLIAGKQRLKRHLRALLVPLLADCRCGHQLAEAAAQAAVEGLRAWIGPNIFAGECTAFALGFALSCMMQNWNSFSLVYPLPTLHVCMVFASNQDIFRRASTRRRCLVLVTSYWCRSGRRWWVCWGCLRSGRRRCLLQRVARHRHQLHRHRRPIGVGNRTQCNKEVDGYGDTGDVRRSCAIAGPFVTPVYCVGRLQLCCKRYASLLHLSGPCDGLWTLYSALLIRACVRGGPVQGHEVSILGGTDFN